jgi:hypothetical protein
MLEAMSRPANAAPQQAASSDAPDLATELRQAIADIERGDYLELTHEQLREWAEKGELAVLDEWLESPG